MTFATRIIRNFAIVGLLAACQGRGGVIAANSSVIRDSTFAVGMLQTVSVDVGLNATPGADGTLFGMSPGEQAALTDALRGLLERRLREQGIAIVNGASDSVRLWLRVRPIAAMLPQALTASWEATLGISRAVQLHENPSLVFRTIVWSRSRSGGGIRGFSEIAQPARDAATELVEALVGDFLLAADTLGTKRAKP